MSSRHPAQPEATARQDPELTHHERARWAGVAVERSAIESTSVVPRAFEHDDTLLTFGWSWLQYDIVEHTQRIVLARDSAAARAPRRLTPREFQIAYLTALGLAGKEIAARLHVSEGTVRTISVEIQRKLGLLANVQLPAFWMALGQTARSVRSPDSDLEYRVFVGPFDIREPTTTLTVAERSILLAVMRGCNNPLIAQQRSSSRRTVANQVAALFAKYGVCSRLELAAKALGVGPAPRHAEWMAFRSKCGPRPLGLAAPPVHRGRKELGLSAREPAQTEVTQHPHRA